MDPDFPDVFTSEVDLKAEAVDSADKEKITLALSTSDFRSYAGDNALNEFTAFSNSTEEEKRESKTTSGFPLDDEPNPLNNELLIAFDDRGARRDMKREESGAEISSNIEDAATSPHVDGAESIRNDGNDGDESESRMRTADGSTTDSKESVVNELRVSPARHKLSLDDEYGPNGRTLERSDNSDVTTGSYVSGHSSGSSNENVTEALRHESATKAQQRNERLLDDDSETEVREDKTLNFCLEQRKVKYSVKESPRKEKRRADDRTTRAARSLTGDEGLSAEQIGFSENQEGIKKISSRNVSFLKDKAHNCLHYIRPQVGETGRKRPASSITDEDEEDSDEPNRVTSDITRSAGLAGIYDEGEQPVTLEKSSASEGRVLDSFTVDAHKNSSLFDGIALRRVQEEVALDKAAGRSCRKMTVIASSKSESAAGANLSAGAMTSLCDVRGTSWCCGELQWDAAYDNWCQEEEANGRVPRRSISGGRDDFVTTTILPYGCVAIILTLMCLVLEFPPYVAVMLASFVSLGCFKVSEIKAAQYQYRTLVMEPRQDE